MERLIINTGLDGFIMPDKITMLTATTIEAVKIIDDANNKDYIKNETMAQICALHTRFCLDYEKHAFLLKTNEFIITSDLTDYGEILINAEIMSSGKEAFLYNVRAFQTSTELFTGKLLIAVTDYGDTFKKEMLKEHYRNIFSCLTKDL